MGAVWLTSRSLRLATCAVVKLLHSVYPLSNHHFYTTNKRLIKRYLLGVVKKLTPLLCVNLEICILNYPSEPRL